MQGLIIKAIYGQRDDPYAVLSRLGERLETTLETDSALPSIVEAVGKALHSLYAALELRVNGTSEVAASYGQPESESTKIPIVFHGEDMGQLLVAPRGPGQAHSASDQRLLDDLARQAGVVVHNVRLAADLQRSRQRLVGTREEERWRLSRDLHDGLGPVLAGFALKLDATRNLIPADPSRAEASLDQFKAQTQSAIGDIRRLVYGLRPPALDELGLIHAIREFASQLNGHNGDSDRSQNNLNLSVRGPESLPLLVAGVHPAQAGTDASDMLAQVGLGSVASQASGAFGRSATTSRRREVSRELACNCLGRRAHG